MKKIMISIAALVLAASCVNKVEVKTPEAGSGLKAVTVLGDETKVSYVDGTGFQWHEGESAGLVTAGQGCYCSYLKADNISENGFDATFYFDIADEGTYTLFHPCDPASEDGAIRFGVSPVQEQEREGFADTWFASRFPLIGKEPVTLSGEKAATTGYKLVGSVVRFYIGGISNDAAGYGEYLRSVTIEADKNIAGTIVTDNTGAKTKVEDGSTEVKVLTYQQLYQEKPGEGKGVYAVVVPVENAMVKYTVRTSYGTYTFTKTTAVTWENGAKYDVVLNLANAEFTEDKTPERLFIIGNGCNAGWSVQDGIALDKQADGVTFKGQVVLYQGGEFRFMAQRCNGAYTDNYAKADDTHIQQWVSSNYVPNFKVENGAGLYDITVNTQDMTVAFEHLAPYFRGSTEPANWSFPGVQMTAVEGMPGVFTLDVNWGNNGGDFKFHAVGDTWDYAYLCADTATEASFNFTGNTILDNSIVFTRFVDKDNKWNVVNYGCQPSVTYILDTKNMKLTCVPRLAVIGGNWEGSGWLPEGGSWAELAEASGHKMTLDVANSRWYIDVTVPEGAEKKNFRIFSLGTTGYGWDNGVWLQATNDGDWVLEGAKNAVDAHVRTASEGDSNWTTIMSWTEETGEQVVTGDLRISLDYSGWGVQGKTIKIYYEKLEK